MSILMSAGANHFFTKSATEVPSKSTDDMDANCLISSKEVKGLTWF